MYTPLQEWALKRIYQFLRSQPLLTYNYMVHSKITGNKQPTTPITNETQASVKNSQDDIQ